MPLVNTLYNNESDAKNADRFPLGIQHFTQSGLVSLTHTVDPDMIFKNYSYRSGVSQTFKNHCKEINKKFESAQLVADIGGNDGTLLAQSRAKIKHCIDPYSELSDEAVSANVSRLKIKFGWDSISNNLLKKYDVVFTTNCYQHVQDLVGFANSVRYILNNNGVWLLEFPDFHKTGLTYYDQIYHEHIYYYTEKTVRNLFLQCGLEIVESNDIDIHSGTKQLVVAKGPRRYIIDPENAYNFTKQMSSFEKIIEHQKSIIAGLKGKKVALYGAAAKGCTVLNYHGLTSADIMYCVDDTPEKQGKYIAGAGIPIVPRSEFEKVKPDVVIIQAHNFYHEIRSKIPANLEVIKLF